MRRINIYILVNKKTTHHDIEHQEKLRAIIKDECDNHQNGGNEKVWGKSILEPVDGVETSCLKGLREQSNNS